MDADRPDGAPLTEEERLAELAAERAREAALTETGEESFDLGDIPFELRPPGEEDDEDSDGSSTVVDDWEQERDELDPRP